MTTRGLIACVLGLLLSGCAIGPNFERPVVDTPAQYRGASPPAASMSPDEAEASDEAEQPVEPAGAGEAEQPVEPPDPAEPAGSGLAVDPQLAESMADLPWWEVFEDSVLQDLLKTSLEQNYDIKIAVARTEQARNQVIATRSAFFPQVDYQGSARRSHYPINLLGDSQQKFTSFLGWLSVAWEIDIWGRIRRANEAAKAELLASEDNQRAVLLSLVSQVASHYLQLLELDAKLQIAEEAVAAFQDTYDLFDRKYKGGVASKLEVTRAAAAEAQASASVPNLKIQIEAMENHLSLLLGRPPGPIPRGAPLAEQRLPEIPPGLPSELLERRPDILQAEQAVVATNAAVGVAMGNFLPRVGLTSMWGASSDKLSELANGSASLWNLAGEFGGPLFRGGMLYAEYKARVAQWEEAKASYEQTALAAFGEVSDALVARRLLRDQRIARERQSQQLAESVRLSLLRYNQGLASYFEVLQAQQEFFPALIDLAETRTEELQAVISLYKSLGGGWKLGTTWLPGP
ncbi:MAG: efflux transporter outer membrane subunit [Myxococcota bacterium]|nr:efflux transporter outer membrane subunit [bacterium]MDP6075442.1 efflux transporter outer membrane subunit [Myxococcota bacterium]MDP7432826.1 efflux transporter outer membrane subunit [Myxococcota bacterium]